MNGFQGTKVIPPRRREPIKPRVRRKPPKLNRAIEHRTLGTGMLLWVRQLSDGRDVAFVRFGDGVERTICLDAAYWLTPVDEIRQLAPHLKPPPTPKPIERESAIDGGRSERCISAFEENDGEEAEPELGEDERGDEEESRNEDQEAA